MKKIWIKGIKSLLVSGFLVASLGGSVGTAEAAANTAPIMKDNLSKYGLVKDVELPVTVTAGGLSYTLEKIMIYDIKSTYAQDLIKKYGYPKLTNMEAYYKYFVWTKLTLENKSDVTIEATPKNTFAHQWSFTASDEEINDGGTLKSMMPLTDYYHIKNSKEALWGYSLKPGEKLTTYQAYTYRGNKFNYLKINLDVNGSKADQSIATKAN
ncbi:hypothetical protein [Paenibacillus odorifer]|uniref:hypothetical protein n=1 Tax=Paenibacillus odorifer TaxID=189426 RepID=UPI00096F06D6|nr:hypothetical protein [Paenibacillus odorifer]OMD08209.1 hypothetical protein BJP47_30105 [Paenibacillus odorifer]